MVSGFYMIIMLLQCVRIHKVILTQFPGNISGMKQLISAITHFLSFSKVLLLVKTSCLRKASATALIVIKTI